MAEVMILLEGYTNSDKRAKGEDEESRPTIALVKDGNFIILTDPGVMSDQNILVDALSKEGLTIDDITHIFLTHSHLDHYRNVGMFPKAKVVEYFGFWDGGKCDKRPKNITPDIELVETPGHNSNSMTMLVNTNKGKVAIVGDLWWSERGPENDPFASDPIKLKENRSKIKKAADWIIPGHGPIFRAGDACV